MLRTKIVPWFPQSPGDAHTVRYSVYIHFFRLWDKLFPDQICPKLKRFITHMERQKETSVWGGLIYSPGCAGNKRHFSTTRPWAWCPKREEAVQTSLSMEMHLERRTGESNSEESELIQEPAFPPLPFPCMLHQVSLTPAHDWLCSHFKSLVQTRLKTVKSLGQ